MAPSSSRSGRPLSGTRLWRRIAWSLATACILPLALACNGIIGVSDYTRAECSGGGVCADGGGPDVLVGDGGPDANGPDAKVDAAGTLPVSWAAWPMPNYDAGTPVDNPMGYDAVVGQGLEDRVTKLVWRHPMPDSSQVSYQKALEICSGEWRLPSRIELVTLLDLGQPGAKIDPAFKTESGTAQGVYWTFSEVRSAFRPFGADGKREHWVVDFSGVGGLLKRDENGGDAYVRCVKGGR